MGETIVTPGDNNETLKDEQNQEEKTSKDLLENFDFQKDSWEKDEGHEDDEEKRKHKNELAIDYWRDNPFFYKGDILDKDCDLFCSCDLDYLQDILNPFSEIDVNETLTFDEASELTQKFWVFIVRTRQHHGEEEIKKNWDIIKERRNKILVLCHLGRRENIFIDILDDWDKIESIWLTDDKVTMDTAWKIQDMIDLIGCIGINDLEIATKLTYKEIEKITDIVQRYQLTDIQWHNFLELKDLTPEEAEKKRRNADWLWLEEVSADTFNILGDISEEVLDYCVKNEIKYWTQISFVKNLFALKDKQKFKEYISRKHECLSKNKKISDEKYVEYFWKKWKHWKQWINQWRFWLCYMYSTIETLKKMNWFDELIQTNFIENDEGWLVRLPFQTWLWIQVWKDEIDKHYWVMDNSAISLLLGQIFDKQIPRRMIRINSNTESLWIKILEIACIKNMLINGKISIDSNWNILERKFIDSKLKKGRWTIKSPLNLKNITGNMLEKIEWWDSLGSLMEILWKWNVSSWIYNAIRDILSRERLQVLQAAKAPKSIINAEKHISNRSGKVKETAFKSFNLWFLSIYIDIDQAAVDKLWKRETKDKKFISISDVKILDEYWNDMPVDKLKKNADISVDENWNVYVRLFSRHAYSVERCYVDEKWQKRIRLVNPRHTEVKFDVPYEQCRDNFRRRIWIINFDNLFR